MMGAVRAPEIGYIFNSSYWGYGYATEALRAFMPLFFEHYSGQEVANYDVTNLGDTANGNISNGAVGKGIEDNREGKGGISGGDRMAPRFEYAEAHTDTELLASQNVLTKIGFKLYEKREKDFENPLLGWRDSMIYRIYRPDAKKEEGDN
jgi:hypothetical protein